MKSRFKFSKGKKVKYMELSSVGADSDPIPLNQYSSEVVIFDSLLKIMMATELESNSNSSSLLVDIAEIALMMDDTFNLPDFLLPPLIRAGGDYANSLLAINCMNQYNFSCASSHFASVHPQYLTQHPPFYGAYLLSQIISLPLPRPQPQSQFHSQTHSQSMIAAEKFLLQPIASICETARQFYKNGNLPDLHEALGENLFKIGSVPAAMAHANALFGFDNDNDNNNDSPNFQLSCLNLFAPTHRHPPKMFYLIRQCLLFLSPPTLESIAVSSLKRIQLHQMLKFWLSPSSTINISTENPVLDIGTRHVFLTVYQGATEVVADIVIYEQLVELHKRLSPTLLNYSNVQSPPPPLAPVPAKRRIGLISAHLKWHSVGRLLHGVFTNLATSSQFDLFFIFVGDHDQSNSNIDFTKTLDAAHHIHLNPNDFKSNQQTLTQLNLDVLIFSDLNLDSATTFLAYGRYARVQIGFWGHPVSSMLDSMDYFVGSELWAKKGEDHSFGEQVILFDSMTTHFAEPPIATTPYIPRYPNNTLYLCAQTIMKLNPLFDPVFNEILQSDHNSVIVLIGNSHQLLWAELVKMRILDSVDAGKAHRIVFLNDQLSYDEYMGLVCEADVTLDPFPFGGGVTILESLFCGVGVATDGEKQTVFALASGWNKRLGRDSRGADYVAEAIRIANAKVKVKVKAEAFGLFNDKESIVEWEGLLRRI